MLPSTGVRDITSLVRVEVVSGRMLLARFGSMVTLVASEIQLVTSVSSQIVSLPSGFRPITRLNDEWTNRGATRGYVDVYTSGSVWAGVADSSTKYSRLLTYPTNDQWPSSLPGEPGT